jgi:hypothetical protein
LEPGLQTPLPKKLIFKDEGKIRELARRGEAWQTSEDRQLLDYAIAKVEGGVYLRLSPEQHARLRRLARQARSQETGFQVFLYPGNLNEDFWEAGIVVRKRLAFGLEFA